MTRDDVIDQLAFDDRLVPVIHTGRWLPGETHCSAVISQDGQYRWSLQRSWSNAPMCAFVMLNPSTADAYTDDATIRRIAGSERRPGFARRWGYGGVSVVNLYALRSTDPKALWRHRDPIGPGNDDELRFVAANFPLTVLAWGAHAPRDRATAVARLLWDTSTRAGNRLGVLGWTKHGAPRHPLYVAADTPLEFCDEGEIFD